MILADIVKLSAAPSVKIPSSLKEEYKSLLEEKSKVFGSLSKTSSLFDNIENRNRDSIEKNRFLHKRLDFFNKVGVLPNDLSIDKNDPLSLASKSPRVDLNELRKTAETLDFVLIPFEYMRNAAYEAESDSTKNIINNFNKEMSRIGTVYTLCPTNCYDVFKHVLAEKDLPVFGSSKNYFLQSLSALLPIHRITFAAINSLQKQVAKIGEKTDNLDNQLASISTEFSRRIDEIASQNRLRLAEKINERESRKQANSKESLATLKDLASQVQSFITAFEPLMFMVPAGIDILSDNASCIVGPCWGPDFDDIVFTIFGFKKIVGQREFVAKESQKWNF